MYSDIVKFIREVYQQPHGVIPLHAPVFLGNEKKYLVECIETNFVSYIGEFVSRFEEVTASYTGAGYAIAIVNGTAALQIALMVSGVGYKDEVITQPLTFVATANAIAHAGAKPIFIDVDKETLGMSPESLSDFLEKHTIIRNGQCINKVTGAKIKAIVPVHIFGHPCKIDDIVSIAEKFNIKVVEDAAEALGSFYKGQHLGTFGEMGIISYNGNKTITTGGGGMILTNNEDLALKIRHITTTAKVPHPWEYYHDVIGYNFRLTNLNAAVGLAQMEKLDLILSEKRKLASIYQNFFEELGVEFQTEPANSKSNYWLNAILLKDRDERNEFLKLSNENKVMTRPIWTLMTKLPMYKNCQQTNLQNSLFLEDRVINIPSSVISK